MPVANPRLPVIILTSIARQNILDVAKDKGAFAALQKDLTTGDELADVALKAMTAIALNGEKAAAPLSARSVSA
jgi:CheY-like chemotaxis protein